MRIRSERLPFMASEKEKAAIDQWRFKNQIATRAEAIRLLIGKGLAAVAAEGGDGAASLATESPATVNRPDVSASEHAQPAE